MARSFYDDNKRVRNDRIKRRARGDLAYPSYREGLGRMLRGELSGKLVDRGEEQRQILRPRKAVIAVLDQVERT